MPEAEVGKLEESPFSVEVCGRKYSSVLGSLVDKSMGVDSSAVKPPA